MTSQDRNFYVLYVKGDENDASAIIRMLLKHKIKWKCLYGDHDEMFVYKVIAEVPPEELGELGQWLVEDNVIEGYGYTAGSLLWYREARPRDFEF